MCMDIRGMNNKTRLETVDRAGSRCDVRAYRLWLDLILSRIVLLGFLGVMRDVSFSFSEFLRPAGRRI